MISDIRHKEGVDGETQTHGRGCIMENFSKAQQNVNEIKAKQDANKEAKATLKTDQAEINAMAEALNALRGALKAKREQIAAEAEALKASMAEAKDSLRQAKAEAKAADKRAKAEAREKARDEKRASKKAKKAKPEQAASSKKRWSDAEYNRHVMTDLVQNYGFRSDLPKKKMESIRTAYYAKNHPDKFPGADKVTLDHQNTLYMWGSFIINEAIRKSRFAA